MHKDLVFTFIRFLALATAPITPHFSEHLWKAVLKEASSVQTALFPEPTGPVDQVALDSIAYVRDLVGQLRQSEIGFAKKKAKGKQTGFDPSKPKSVRLFIAKEWPHWQTQCLDALQSSVDAESKQVDSAKLKQSLASKGLLKEKRAMPFCMMFAVRESGETQAEGFVLMCFRPVAVSSGRSMSRDSRSSTGRHRSTSSRPSSSQSHTFKSSSACSRWSLARLMKALRRLTAELLAKGTIPKSSRPPSQALQRVSRKEIRIVGHAD